TMFPSKVKSLVVIPAVVAALGWTPAGLAEGGKARTAAPPIVRTARSGAWSAPATWEGGKAPIGNVRALVREGHQVVYDVKATQPLRSLTISGTLTFAHDRDTQLDVGLIKIQRGDDPSEEGFDCEAHAGPPKAGKPRAALEVGTPQRPIPARHTALIRLVY